MEKIICNNCGKEIKLFIARAIGYTNQTFEIGEEGIDFIKESEFETDFFIELYCYECENSINAKTQELIRNLW